MSYRELNDLKKKVARINESIEKLEAKKQEHTKKRNTAEREQQDILLSEALEGKEPDERKLERLRKTIENENDKIAELDQRIKLIEETRAESLKPYLADIRKGYDREIDKLKREVDTQFYGARKFLCEYLLALQKAGLARQKAAELHAEFAEYAKMLDPKEYKRNHWDRGNPIPMPVLFNDYAGRKLGIREQDQKQALNGYVEPYVMLYELTGEIEDDPNKARQKLQEVKK
ncbi:hypothetical protein [Heyndrickxia coagulans]|uniref:Uncharacterized protein n=1 Tax=Heyndrickxia coagulans TaxID=1398 RepID=A0AAW7CM63_HEYCO|nr:hypothetical protein [Heyndrickxia coagulans]MDL5039505.1 hypothetical protein [Heyndrickxia coagulans]